MFADLEVENYILWIFFSSFNEQILFSAMELQIGSPFELPTTKKSDRECVVSVSGVSFEESSETLEYYVHENKSVEFFLKVMGVMWLNKNSDTLDKSFQVVWGGLMRLGLVFFTGYGIVIFFINPHLFEGIGLKIIISITMVLQGITMCFAMWDMNRRIKSKAPSHYCLKLSEGLRSSYLVFFISFVLGILPMLSTEDFILFGCEIILSCVLAATMYFISTDCSVALFLLDYLLLQVSKEQLTFEQYSFIRSEIQERQTFSSWINNSIVIVALLDIAAVLLFVLTVSFSINTVIECFIIVGLFFKEIPFLMVVYWQVAQVNEKSYKLLQQLGTSRWSNESHSDHERLTIFVNAQSKPISMSLAGMKLKRRDLAWQFALWVFAFAVSIFKTAFEKRV